jgi:hypothetical protein
MSESRVIVYGTNEDGLLVPLRVTSGATAVDITRIGGVAISASNALPVVAGLWQYAENGVNVNQVVNAANSEILALSSIVRNGNVNTGNQINVSWSDLVCVITVAALTNPVTATIQGMYNSGGDSYTILTSAAIAIPSTVVLRVSPQLVSSAGLIAGDILPPLFRVSLATTGNHTTSIRYLLTK